MCWQYLENVFVEVVLQRLVCVVDAELFEAVVVQVLKSEDIQDRDDPEVLGGVTLAVLNHPTLAQDDLVHAVDQPGEQGGEQRLGNRVPGVKGLKRLIFS